MFLANSIFVASYLKIYPVVHLVKKKSLLKFTSFCYSYVSTHVKKRQDGAEHLDVQIKQTRIPI